MHCRSSTACPARGTAADSYTPSQYNTMMSGMYWNLKAFNLFLTLWENIRYEIFKRPFNRRSLFHPCSAICAFMHQTLARSDDARLIRFSHFMPPDFKVALGCTVFSFILHGVTRLPRLEWGLMLIIHLMIAWFFYKPDALKGCKTQVLVHGKAFGSPSLCCSWFGSLVLLTIYVGTSRNARSLQGLGCMGQVSSIWHRAVGEAYDISIHEREHQATTTYVWNNHQQGLPCISCWRC
jgi:hypothetical protein